MVKDYRELNLISTSRNQVYDSSSDDESNDDQQARSLSISWIKPEYLQIDNERALIGISELPGCRYSIVRRSIEDDIDTIKRWKIEDVFVFCTRNELSACRISDLCQQYVHEGINSHHYPMEVAQRMSIRELRNIIDDIRRCIERGRNILLHCVNGYCRSCVVACALLLEMNPLLSAEEAIQVVRDIRGNAAIQTVAQYNFLMEYKTEATSGPGPTGSMIDPRPSDTWQSVIR